MSALDENEQNKIRGSISLKAKKKEHIQHNKNKDNFHSKKVQKSSTGSKDENNHKNVHKNNRKRSGSSMKEIIMQRTDNVIIEIIVLIINLKINVITIINVIIILRREILFHQEKISHCQKHWFIL